MEPEKVKHIITSLFLEMEDRSLTPDQALARLDDDLEWWVAGTTPFSGTMTKPVMRQQYIQTLEIVETPMKVTPLEWVIDGDTAAVEAESYMKLNNGRVYNNLYHFKIRLKGDKIYRVKEYLDTQHLIEAFSD
jgi:ketosteroid isomerase-like protein